MEIDTVKLITGKTIEELTRIETPEEVALEGKGNPSEVFTLGHGQDTLLVSELERESVHIIGAPGSGKSKLLEFFARHDVDRLLEEEEKGIHPKEGRACGFCFIDPSENGDSINKILSYCAEVGFDRVLLIDPYRYNTHKKFPSINLFDADKTYWESSTNYLVDAFRVLYEVSDLSRTSYITTYLTALFSVMHYTGLTASELIYFTVPPQRLGKDDSGITELLVYEQNRQRIFALAEQKIEGNSFPGDLRDIVRKHLADLQNAFKNIPNFKEEAGSTARRLNTLVTNKYLRLLFGHRDGIDFDWLISEGWIILVNVDTGFGLGTLQARLLATVVINKIIDSIKRLRENGFNKPYYLYIDEAGQYVTHTLADILAHKRKIGLRTILAHQFLGQLKDPLVKDAIMNGTGIKCAFYVEHPSEREDVVKMIGYGGQLSREQVAFNLSGQKKQEMVVKLGKQPPKLVKVPDVPDADGDVDAFLNRLFEDPHYYTLKDIKEDEQARFKALPSENSKGYQLRKKTDGKTTGTAPVPGRVQDRPKENLPPDNEAPRKDEKRKPLDI